MIRADCFVRFFLVVALLLPVRSRAMEAFPLSDTVKRVEATLATSNIKDTGLRREDYLTVISGIVDYFHHFQTNDGRIIDPFLRKEVQYSTPCYAWAATSLIVSGRETNLLESASLALECALTQLAEGRANDGHGDFFMFPAMFAYQHLRDRVTPERRKTWEDLLRKINPNRAYRDVLTPAKKHVNNWNIVALSGEFLRHQDGFTDMSFVENSLDAQMGHFTSLGMYKDPNNPMAYDHFPRHFLAVMLEQGYDGAHKKDLEELMDRAAWTSLLIQSPRGELPTGGRSAQHQWNEAMQCVTYEVWARRKERAGDAVAAKAFKRAAHLALQSMQRWARPSGELWIVKNHFDPAARHGFQSYSSHSQYNLLAASMLATAWSLADEHIAEGASPADTGGFAVELPEFHKVIANAGGLYVEIDTGADPEYNSTGLIRVHKADVNSLVGPSDSTPIDVEALATGIAWKSGNAWKSLASLGHGKIQQAAMHVLSAEPSKVKFAVHYEIGMPEAQSITETYELTRNLVKVEAELAGTAEQIQVRFPAMAFDGESASDIELSGPKAVVTLGKSSGTFRVESPRNVNLVRSGKWISSRNGFVEEIHGEAQGKRVVYSLQPSSTGR